MFFCFFTIRPIFSQIRRANINVRQFFAERPVAFTSQLKETDDDDDHLTKMLFFILIQTTEINWKRHTSTLDRGWGNIDAASTFIGGYKPKRCAIPVGV
jgi:hypothetical protein